MEVDKTHFLFKRTKDRSSCRGTTASVASWECWVEGSIPSPAHWVKDLLLPQLQLRHDFSSDLIPGLGTPYAAGWPKMKKKKKRTKDNNYSVMFRVMGVQIAVGGWGRSDLLL